MNFDDLKKISSEGFEGFKTVGELNSDTSSIPKIKGVYMILSPNAELPEFLVKGTGGFFKGKDPNVSVNKLESSWVENTRVVYIGKAGNDTGDATLNSRIKQLLSFGRGNNIGHWGGRLLWQLKNSSELIVCWKVLGSEDPRIVEAGLIQDFISQFHKRPYANLAD